MRVTTTHDPHGGDHPRLVFWRSDVDATSDNQYVFQLLPGVSTIGGGPDADLRLEGLHDQHGEVRRDTEDEYVYVHLDPDGTTAVDGAPVDRKPLHTGDRLQLGHWRMSFTREEFADHGRPYGGRQGGAGSDQRPQLAPRSRGTSPGGGSDRHGNDPGEYF